MIQLVIIYVHFNCKLKQISFSFKNMVTSK